MYVVDNSPYGIYLKSFCPVDGIVLTLELSCAKEKKIIGHISTYERELIKDVKEVAQSIKDADIRTCALNDLYKAAESMMKSIDILRESFANKEEAGAFVNDFFGKDSNIKE